MKPNTYVFSNPQEVASSFAEWLYFAVVGNSNETIHIALSGGSTPKLLFRELAEKYTTSFPWSRVHFWWGDERCVSPSDIDSNYGVVKQLLFDKVAIPEENVHRVLGESFDLEQECARYENEISANLESVNELPCFDLVLLGMGDDGHTASIFPHQLELLEAEGVCGLATHPVSGQKRITLTGAVINNATAVVFLVTGQGKKEKYDEIHSKSGNYKQYPSYYIQPTHGILHWFVDKAVVGK